VCAVLAALHSLGFEGLGLLCIVEGWYEGACTVCVGEG
jgi:hypothetical protein